MRPSLTLLLSVVLTVAQAQPFNWQWSRIGDGTTTAPEVHGMVTDNLGNSYVTGLFYATATFGLLPSINSAGMADVYVVKYNNQGTPLWVVRAGGSDMESALDIALDNAGHVYITGHFQSATALFGGTTLVPQGSMDAFCARLDGSDGSFVWAKSFGGAGTASEEGTAIDCDVAGNVYLTGYFKYTLVVPGLTNLVGCAAYTNVFLLKLDPDGNGIWSMLPECGNGFALGSSAGQALEVDGIGDVYLGFAFRGDSLFIGTDTLMNAIENGDTFDGVLAKYDLDGNYQWARRIGSSGYDDVEALAVDSEGRCFVAMHRENSYNFPGIQLNYGGSEGGYKNVLLKLSADGDYLWGERMGNSTYDHNITGLELDDDGHIFLGGWFDGNFEIDGVEPTSTEPGTHGMYVARLDTSGALEEVFAARHFGTRNVQALGLDGGYNVYIAGFFQETLAFPGLSTYDIPGLSMFIARSGDFNTSVPLPPDVNASERAYPNPSSGNFTVQSERMFTGLCIVNALGGLVLQESFPPTALREVQLQENANGVIFYTLLNGAERVGSGRVVVQR